MSRVISWGSYDLSKPRVRLLLAELEARGMLRAEINMPVWKPIRDKAVAGPLMLLQALVRLLSSYPSAMMKLLRQSSRSVVLLPYPAIPDVFFAWPIARLRRHSIIFDAFISLHDTVVADRALVRPGGLASRLIWAVEWIALRLADVILVDTDQHGDFFAAEFGIDRDRFQTILVGAEPAFWDARSGAHPVMDLPTVSTDLPIVLFYGQLIPLHGIDTILEAIGRTSGEPMHWLLIGSGQEEPKLRTFLDEHHRENVSWIPWVEYQRLPAFISAASIGLGIFGTSDKAARVIPNKVFQILAAGKPVVTRASPAMNAIVDRYPRAIITVPAGDGAALASAVREALRDLRDWQTVPVEAAAELGAAQGVQALVERLDAA